MVSVKTFADYSGKAAKQDLSHIVTIYRIDRFACLPDPDHHQRSTECRWHSWHGSFDPAECHCKKWAVRGGCRRYRPFDFGQDGHDHIGQSHGDGIFTCPGVAEKEFAQLLSWPPLSDETPEGRSIVVLAKNKFDLRARIR